MTSLRWCLRLHRDGDQELLYNCKALERRHSFREVEVQARCNAPGAGLPFTGSRLCIAGKFDPTHIFLKYYGGSALLEDSCSSTLHNDIDGDSKGANGGGGASARKSDEDEEKASKESTIDKLTNTICDKLWAKANVTRGGKDTGIQRDFVSTLEKKKVDKSDPFQQVVSTVRSMVLKNKAKAAAGDKSGVPKPEIEEREKFLDMESFEAGGESGMFGGSNGSSKDLQLLDMVGKTSKQKPSQSQFSHLQRTKDAKEGLSFLNSLDDTTPLSSILSTDEDYFSTHTETSKSKAAVSFTETDDSWDDLLSREKKPPQIKDAMPGSATHGSVKLKMPKGKDTALPQAAQDSSRANIWNQVSGKSTPPAGTFGFKAKRSDDAPLTQSHGKTPPFAKEAASPPPSHQDNSIPRTGHMVCVQNLPSSCNPAMIKSAMANHGEVLGFFKKAIRNDFFNVYIEFKTEQSMEAAIASRKLQIGNKSFFIARTDKVLSTVVRLCKVSNETTEKQLLSTCEKFGSIDDIRKRINGIYDVFYDVKELPNMTNILASLNEVTFHRSTWVAAPAPLVHPSVQNDLLKSPEGQAWLNTQVNQALNRIESGIDGMTVFFEDLKELTALGKEFSKR